MEGKTLSVMGSPRAAVPLGMPTGPGTTPPRAEGMAAPAPAAPPPLTLVFAGVSLTLFFTPPLCLRLAFPALY